MSEANEANAAVDSVLSEEQAGGNGQKKSILTPQQRAKQAKYVSECGNTAAVRNFSNHSLEKVIVTLFFAFNL